MLWFTGLSESGKSTIANALELALHARGRRTNLLDGDNVRQGLNRGCASPMLTARKYSPHRRVARLAMDAGLVGMTAFISPSQRERQMGREVIGEASFVEVYVSTSLEVCEARDPRGLYKKAHAGELPNMSGIGSSYGRPEIPDIVADAFEEEVEALIVRLLARMKVGMRSQGSGH